MSKSKGNVVSIDETCDRFGADATRLFHLFLGPPEHDAEWQDNGIEGTSRFLSRVWRLCTDEVGTIVDRAELTKADHEMRAATHRTLIKVGKNLDTFGFNLAVAAVMELTNEAFRWLQSADGGARVVFEEFAEKLLLILAPMAPHLSAELWERRGLSGTVHRSKWPEADANLARLEQVLMVIQVNGKVRDKIQVPADISEQSMLDKAMASESVRKHIGQSQISRVVSRPPALINLVIG